MPTYAATSRNTERTISATWLTFALCWGFAAKIAWSGDEPTPKCPVGLKLKGLENVFRIHETLYSGSGPEDDIAFDSLRTLGIKTVLSVDGARPDVERARKFGLRYVHIPIGYNGIPRDKALQIAKAVRELPGPIYIHCHHGKHRGPAGAAIARLCLDDKCVVADALAILRAAGTDARYSGLFKSVREFQRPTADDLAKIGGKLPEAVQAGGLVEAMISIDHYWDNLKLARSAGWKTPKGHSDVDPAHEALQLGEGFQELKRLPKIAGYPDEFRNWIEDNHSAALQLERLLGAANAGQPNNLKAADAVFARISTGCVQCHAKYRDAVTEQPRKP